MARYNYDANPKDTCFEERARKIPKTSRNQRRFQDEIDEDHVVKNMDNSDSNTAGSESNYDSDTEHEADEIDWEDVTLDGSISLQVDFTTKTVQKPVTIHKKKNDLISTRLRYGLHIMEIPILLGVLQYRRKLLNDTTLIKCLKRSVPKLIRKKFIKWDNLETEQRQSRITTLLLGLILWFRSNYKINSNGFRQNSTRLNILLNNKNQDASRSERFYGSTPADSNPLDMIRKRMGNRDWLTLIFAALLRTLIPKSTIGICFALPVHQYSNKVNKIHKSGQRYNPAIVPNKYDTDLLQPYFWIELYIPTMDNRNIYIVDPVVHQYQKNIIVKCDQKNGFTDMYLLLSDRKLNPVQDFQYVVKTDLANGKLEDVSPRYIPNLVYRYFESTDGYAPWARTKLYKSFQFYQRCVNALNGSQVSENPMLRDVALRNLKLPKSLGQLKLSVNFTAKELLSKSEVLAPGSQPMISNCKMDDGCKLSVYTRDRVLKLRSKLHWALLGRTVPSKTRPKAIKEYVPLSNRSKGKLNDKTTRGLFSFAQTIKTHRLPHYYWDKSQQEVFQVQSVLHYRNSFGHVEIYDKAQTPKGFVMVPIEQKGIDIRKLIKQENKKKLKRIVYLDIVSGFNFKIKPGHATPIISYILVNLEDANRIRKIVDQYENSKGLQHWNSLLRRIIVSQTLNDRYNNVM